MSFESEKAVIGCLLLDADCLSQCQNLKAFMFNEKVLKLIFYKAQGLFDNMKPVNATEIVQACKSDKLSESQLREILRECVSSVVTSAEIKSYANSVVSDYRCRETKKYLLKNEQNIFPETIEDVLRDINSFSESLLRNEKTENVSAKGIADKYKSQRFCKREKERITIGIDAIDDLTGGLDDGDVIVIGARPSVGKSAFATQMISHVCKKGKRVGYYNLEMPDGQVYDRFISFLSGIDMGHLRNATCFLNDDKERFEKANDIFSGYKLDIVTGKSSASEIMISARHMNYDVIVIDYLQLMKPEKSYTGNRSSEVGSISKALKEIAMYLKIPVILLSQLNRASEARETKEPTMADLRESGDIEQDASVIMLIWNASEDKMHKCLKIEKDRQSKLGRVNLDFDGAHMRFTESGTEWHEAKGDKEDPAFS